MPNPHTFTIKPIRKPCNYHISSIIRQCKGKTKSRRNMYFRYYYEVQ